MSDTVKTALYHCLQSFASLTSPADKSWQLLIVVVVAQRFGMNDILRFDQSGLINKNRLNRPYNGRIRTLTQHPDSRTASDENQANTTRLRLRQNDLVNDMNHAVACLDICLRHTGSIDGNAIGTINH